MWKGSVSVRIRGPYSASEQKSDKKSLLKAIDEHFFKN
jgi:hypothetical protein